MKKLSGYFHLFTHYAMKEAMTTRTRKMKDAKKDKHIIPENCSKTIQMYVMKRNVWKNVILLIDANFGILEKAGAV